MRRPEYYIARSRMTGKRHAILGRNMYYPWLLDIRQEDPAEDWVLPAVLARIFFKIEKEFGGKWEALTGLSGGGA